MRRDYFVKTERWVPQAACSLCGMARVPAERPLPPPTGCKQPVAPKSTRIFHISQ